jgi:hypothetical protein
MGGALLWAGAVKAQTLGGAQSVDVPLWRVVGAFVLCAVLALGAALAMRARVQRGAGAPASARGQAWPQLLGAFRGLLSGLGRAPAERRLQVLESVRLNHQVDICLIRYDGRDLLVATSPQGATLLEPGGGPKQRTKAP